MTDEDAAAVAEIKSLTEAARSHLKHVLRNGLQSILADMEMSRPEKAREEVFILSERLRRLLL